MKQTRVKPKRLRGKKPKTGVSSSSKPKPASQIESNSRNTSDADLSHEGWSTEDSDTASVIDTQTDSESDILETKTPDQTAFNVEQDPFAYVDSSVLEDSREKRCEIHTYDCRQNSRGESIVLWAGSKQDLPEDVEKSPEAALVYTRHYDWSKALVCTELEIKSPYIAAALRQICQSYPGVRIGSTGSIKLYNEPRCLFHHRNELQEHAVASDNPQVKEHIVLCLRYMDRALRNEILAYDSMMKCDATARGLEFHRLWMAFKPGSLAYERMKGAEQVERFIRMDLRKEKVNEEKWELRVQRIECDGEVFGRVESSVFIEHYNGFKAFQDLPIFPLEYHKEQTRIRRDVTVRGKKYVSLLGHHHRAAPRRSPWLPSENDDEVRQRIMIDPHEYYTNLADKPVFVPGSTIATDSDQHLRLSDEEYLICDYKMPGWICSGRWSMTDVSQIENIEFNSSAFDMLVLDQHKKDMIMSLVRASKDCAMKYGDLTRGEGRGIIFLLHGPPGVGKTFTAESVAEYTQRPLFIVSCGELGVDARKAEVVLSTALAQATRWNAVMLIDEADVFMAKRKINDLARNELVSVLLRALESFDGILFLTTNRVEVLDPAFKSRIHFSVAYPSLSVEARRKLWKIFILKGLAVQQPSWLDDEYLSQVGETEMNGRQIKNAVRVAYALAADKGCDLGPDDIISTLQALRDFDKDFSGRSTEEQEKGKAHSKSGKSGKSTWSWRSLGHSLGGFKSRFHLKS